MTPMKRIHQLGLTMVVAGGVLLAGLPVQAADKLAVVKQRMEQRLTDVLTLKRTGRVGETNQGLLQALQAVSPAEKTLIEEENQDRAMVYAAIARKAGGSAGDAGARRAKQIAAAAESGTRIQSDAGRWMTK